MTALIAPRYELPLVDPETGRMSREWYKFLAQLAKSVGTSPTTSDDLQLFENTDTAAVEALALRALQDTRNSPYLLFEPVDQPKAVDLSLLAWWPPDQK